MSPDFANGAITGAFAYLATIGQQAAQARAPSCSGELGCYLANSWASGKYDEEGAFSGEQLADNRYWSPSRFQDSPEYKAAINSNTREWGAFGVLQMGAPAVVGGIIDGLVGGAAVRWFDTTVRIINLFSEDPVELPIYPEPPPPIVRPAPPIERPAFPPATPPLLNGPKP